MQTDMHPQVMALPRVKIVCGRDWLRGPGRHFQIGVLWDATPWPRLGELIYRRQWLIRITFDNGYWR